MDKVLREVAVDRILPAHFQARQVFPDQVIAQLAASMKEVGQNTPLLVRSVAPPPGAADSKDWFELVCGECRLRAAKSLSWKKLWAVVDEMTDEEAALRGMVDNEQRHSFNPIERAAGYQKLMTDYNLSQEKVSERSGVDASTLSRLLSLLDEPAEIQELLKKGSLTVFHCRPLDRIADRKKRARVAKEVAQAGMSAKETEKRVQRLIGAKAKKRSAEKDSRPADLATDYSGFRFWWEGDEVAIRARNYRPQTLVNQYVSDFRLALEGFLRNEPNPKSPETSKLSEPESMGTTQNASAGAAHVMESLKPLANIIQDLAKVFDVPGPAKK
jgi:ParB family transcriptional regulator, chromosome partitioning protein